MKQITDRILQSVQAGKNETLRSPRAVQLARSSRHRGGFRYAKIQSGGVGTESLTCKLSDSEGNVTGGDIAVYPKVHFGSNELDDDVWPELDTNDIIPVVYHTEDGKWRTDFIFDDVDPC